MLCYKGRSFCSRSNECGNIKCDRLADEGDVEEAEMLGLPIQYAEHFSTNCGFVKFCKDDSQPEPIAL